MNEAFERIERNMKEIRGRIEGAAERSGRKGEDVTLVVVSKFRTEEEITAAIMAGATDIGENRVQDAMKKRRIIPEGVRYRLIGHLQRNKAADAARTFDAVDSVDSIRLAEKLSHEAALAGLKIPVLIEVNSSGEASKHGFEPDETADAVGKIIELPGLIVRGLMTIGPLTEDEKDIRKAFRLTRKIFEVLKPVSKEFDTLSMGMSGDYEAAIEEGSTMARIGRAIF